MTKRTHKLGQKSEKRLIPRCSLYKGSYGTYRVYSSGERPTLSRWSGERLAYVNRQVDIITTREPAIRSMRVSKFALICPSRYRREKTEMLVPNCIGWYGREVGFRPCCLVGKSKLNVMILFDIWGSKLNCL